MFHPARRPLGLTSTFLRVFGALALAAQIAVVLAPLAEGRLGVGMAAHVESRGSHPTHYTHEESTCIACQVRTFYGSAAGRAVVQATPPIRAALPKLPSTPVVSSDRIAYGMPRAPPSVI